MGGCGVIGDVVDGKADEGEDKGVGEDVEVGVDCGGPYLRSGGWEGVLKGHGRSDCRSAKGF